jgi:hypothetical protein
MSNLAALSAAVGAAVFAPTATSHLTTPLPEAFPFEEERRLEEFMDGDISVAEKVIFYFPRLLQNLKLDVAAAVFRFWLFRDAPPPYRLTAAREGVGRPRADEQQTIRDGPNDLDVFLVPYDRLLEESPLLRTRENTLRARISGEIETRAALRGAAAPAGTRVEQVARAQWRAMFDRLAEAPVGTTLSFGDFERFDAPELTVTFEPVGSLEAVASLTDGLNDHNAALGALGIVAYVAGTARREKGATRLTFSHAGIRLRDVFEFSGFQPLGIWNLERGLSLGSPANTAVLANSTFQSFASDFRERYQKRAAIAGTRLSPLSCRDFFITSRVKRDDRKPHDDIVVPDPAKT